MAECHVFCGLGTDLISDSGAKIVAVLGTGGLLGRFEQLIPAAGNLGQAMGKPSRRSPA